MRSSVKRELSSREGSCSEEAGYCLTFSRNGVYCYLKSLEDASEEKIRDDRSDQSWKLQFETVDNSIDRRAKRGTVQPMVRSLLLCRNMVQEWLGMCLFESPSGFQCISTQDDKKKGDMAGESKCGIRLGVRDNRHFQED